MPKNIKVKVKKTARPEEEVKGLILKSLEWFKYREKLLLIAFVSVVIIAGATTAFFIYKNIQDDKASAIEYEAYKYLYGLYGKAQDPERLKKAISLYEKTNSIRPSAMNEFYMATCYTKLGDVENALKRYRTITEKYKNSNITPLAYYKKAALHLRLGQTEEALKGFNGILNLKGSMYKDLALYEIARIYESLGRPEEAKRKYRELLEKFPTSPWSIEAKAKV